MAETKTLNKWFWVWDFEKEERWLNEMANEGWALCSVGYCRYTFERCEAGEYIIRLEMHDKNDTSYLSFIEEMDGEYIGNILQWIFIRRKASLGAFDLYSDIDSKISHLSKICKTLRPLMLANIAIGIANAIAPHRLGILNLLAAALLAYGYGRISEKKENLSRERLIRE